MTLRTLALVSLLPMLALAQAPAPVATVPSVPSLAPLVDSVRVPERMSDAVAACDGVRRALSVSDTDSEIDAVCEPAEFD